MKTFVEWEREQNQPAHDEILSGMLTALQDIVSQCRKWAPSIDCSHANHAIRLAQQAGIQPIGHEGPSFPPPPGFHPQVGGR